MTGATQAARPGTVYLVGAGPGDPGLITVRGRDLVASADALVVDALAGRALLAWARPDAEVHDAGKEGYGRRVEQDDTSALLVRLARSGRSVVRLKGGDPFLFGRGGEECEALARAGVAYEVVPGVSSAVAVPAAAGIPVTHRDVAGHVTVLAGRRRDARSWSPAEARRHAELLADGTLVVLMGSRDLRPLLDALAGAGAPAGLPAAAVQWGTDPRQRVCVATLSSLAARVAEAGMGRPLVVVLGAVVAVRERVLGLAAACA